MTSSTEKSFADTKKSHIKEKIPFAAFGILNVTNEVGNVTIEEESYKAKDLEVNVIFHAEKEEDLERLQNHFKKIKRENQLDIEGKIPKNCPSCKIDLKILVPLTKEIKTNVGIGNSHFSNIAGVIRSKANIGNIKIKSSLGPIEVQTNTGNISIDQPKENVKAKTNVGNISISQAKKDVYAKTNVGNIFVEKATEHKGTINIKSSIGKSTLK